MTASRGTNCPSLYSGENQPSAVVLGTYGESGKGIRAALPFLDFFPEKQLYGRSAMTMAIKVGERSSSTICWSRCRLAAILLFVFLGVADSVGQKPLARSFQDEVREARPHSVISPELKSLLAQAKQSRAADKPVQVIVQFKHRPATTQLQKFGRLGALGTQQFDTIRAGV